jgi:hypothetical protein
MTTTARTRFSIFVYFYLGIFLLLLAFFPLCFAATIGRPAYWLASAIWPVVIITLWGYSRSRCSSDRMPFGDGLLWVTASMMTGWLYMSFAVVFPALLVVFWASVLIALYGDICRVPGYSQAKWQGLVHYFYRHRMRQ